ncbi:hypothetical protein [Ekhidna sp.]|uniref:hypothetical protein n=1 Tax=Ekhidna sp. TaxID=2608089 RepID=UPI0032F04D8A
MKATTMNEAVVKSPLRISVVFLWIGFVCAISFMEAWLKFQAPGITLSLGLGIGRLVFGALNKVEIVFAFSLLISIISDEEIKTTASKILMLPLLILFTQSVWLLPALDARAELYMLNHPPMSSNLHVYYVVAEVIKVCGLFAYGLQLFRSRTL